MSSRYACFRTGPELARVTGAECQAKEFEPSWNIAPKQMAPIVRLHPRTRERRLELHSWGFIPHWSPGAITARRATYANAARLATSWTFHEAYASRRCLVLADAFYVSVAAASGRGPFALARADRTLMAFAGVWDVWVGREGRPLATFGIVTTTADPRLVHAPARMPVILERGDWAGWLGEAEADLAALARPAAAERLEMWRVDRSFENPRCNGPALLTPATPPPFARAYHEWPIAL